MARNSRSAIDAPRRDEPERARSTLSEPEGQIPTAMLEALSRNFCREAISYGFKQIDFIRYVNHLLDASMKPGRQPTTGSAAGDSPAPSRARSRALPLAGVEVGIRAFDRKIDLPLLEQWVQEANGRYFLLSSTSPARRSVHELVDSESTVIGTVTSSDGTPIGSMAFLDFDRLQRRAELRKLIGVPSLRGRGFAKEASRLWIDHGLATLGLKKIYLNTTHTNLRNVRLNEELGFKVEGILRNELCVDGEYQDVLRMGLWRD